MLNVTPRARIAIQAMLFDAEPLAGPLRLGFRLLPSETEEEGLVLGLTLDSPRPGDETVEHDGTSLLMFDANTSSLMEDLTLDVIETPDGARLDLRG